MGINQTQKGETNTTSRFHSHVFHVNMTCTLVRKMQSAKAHQDGKMDIVLAGNLNMFYINDHLASNKCVV